MSTNCGPPHPGANPGQWWSPATSCAAGTLSPPPWERGKFTSDEATACATAHANMPLHLISQACSARFLIRGSSLRARAMASALRSPRVSSDHRPPTSIATTTKCARRLGPKRTGALFPPACNLECHTISLRGSTSRDTTSVQNADQCGGS